MTIKEMDKLIKGAYYDVKIVDEDGTFEGVAEYRGLDREVDYLLFLFEGSKTVLPFHYEDVVSHKKI